MHLVVGALFLEAASLALCEALGFMVCFLVVGVGLWAQGDFGFRTCGTFGLGP